MKYAYLSILLLAYSHSINNCQAQFLPNNNICLNNNNCLCEESILKISCSNTIYNDELNNQLPHNIKTLVFDNVPVNMRQPTETLLLKQQGLNTLIWKNSKIKDLAQVPLINLFQLETIDLSENEIEKVQNNKFASNLNLKTLNLSFNKINQIDTNAFDNLDKLEQLYLSNNKIILNNEQIFSSLWNLNKLDLSNNLIKLINNYFFFPNKKLINLNINNNKIDKISKQAFINMNSLLYLDLSSNQIMNISPQIFENFKQLNYLNISNNKINTLLYSTFNELVNLKQLDISDNLFNELSDDLFKSNNKLEYLRIHNTNLEIIKTDLMKSLTNLIGLVINNNRNLKVIENEVFYYKSQLRDLDLSNNVLNGLPHSILKLNLTKLNIINNNWICDCNMAWFAEYWSQNKQNIIPNKSDLRCSKTIYPDLINSLLIPTLRGLNCTPAEIVYTTPKSLLWPYVNITLNCVVLGEPTPTITWLTPQGLTFHWIPEDSISPTFKHHPIVHNVNITPINQSQLFLLQNGSLLITNFDRKDRGNYTCFVSNPLSNATKLISVQLDPLIVYEGKLLSIAFGTICALVFLALTIAVNILIFICRRYCLKESQPKQIQNVLDNIEQYRAQQLNKLQENYTQQVTKIKENYDSQVEKIRDSYKDQVENFRNIKRNGTTHLVSIREQYLDQINKVRDYSTGQLNKVRENYIFQRNRIRKFSSHQMVRIRENYKYQQQALTKVLENLPTLENCKGSCGGYSMSTVYGEELTEYKLKGGLGVVNRRVGLGCDEYELGPIDLEDTESRLSLYFTPPTEHSLSPKSPTNISSSHKHQNIEQPLMKVHTKKVSISQDNLNLIKIYNKNDRLERSQSNNTIETQDKNRVYNNTNQSSNNIIEHHVPIIENHTNTRSNNNIIVNPNQIIDIINPIEILDSTNNASTSRGLTHNNASTSRGVTHTVV